jgi:hypothetical protein
MVLLTDLRIVTGNMVEKWKDEYHCFRIGSVVRILNNYQKDKDYAESKIQYGKDCVNCRVIRAKDSRFAENSTGQWIRKAHLRRLTKKEQAFHVAEFI